MGELVPWNSQPLDQYASAHAEGDFVDLSGKRTHYLARGQGEPVVLIHGFNFDWHTWTRNIDALCERFRVYALDLWGQGLSTRVRALCRPGLLVHECDGNREGVSRGPL